VTRTLASLLVAGALACGCGEAAAPHKPAKPKVTTTVSRASFDPLVAMHADKATGAATYCSSGRQEREYVKWFNENSTDFLIDDSRSVTYLRRLGATVTQVPRFAGRPMRPLVDTLSVGVSAHAHNRAMAIRFLHWMTSPWVMQNEAGWSQASPLRESYGNGPDTVLDTLAGVDAIRKALEHAQPYPSTPGYDGIEEAIGHNVHRALTGSVTAQQALRNMDEEINAALAGDAAGDAS
jgi:ABC-type glycerol-3-phosphate transport system substrate-binding protein